MNIKEIKEMLQLMAEHELAEVEIEKDGLKLKLKKQSGRVAVEEIRELRPTVFQAPVPVADRGAEAAKTSQEPSNIVVIKSPMVGTFYASPAPDQPPYVAGGKKIKTGDVLCIVEAMKLMNEIKAEISGTVVEVMVKNGQPVEFDQPLIKVQIG